ncbi:hypothetical protein HPB47_016661 [Ixodes persulcatus]|nr:hypothetical protein HPB47_016661 [Ixodes persulcatus]
MSGNQNSDKAKATPAEEAKDAGREQGEREALLLYPSNPTEGKEFAQVTTVLRSSLAPEDLGLQRPELRPIRGGAVLLSASKEGIERLEKHVKTNLELKKHLKVKKPFTRNPQIKIRGVVTADPTITRRKLLTQNQLQGAEDDIQIVHTFESNNGLSTIIIEVTPHIFRQLKERRRVCLDWTSCPVEENLHVVFCKRCSRYGHTVAHCENPPRCSDCGLRHNTKECKGTTLNCPCCADAPQDQGRTPDVDIRHSAMSEKCPIFQYQIERLKRRIRYH